MVDQTIKSLYKYLSAQAEAYMIHDLSPDSEHKSS